MPSRWRERKGTFVSAAELHARRKVLLQPVQKYRQAWVQVSIHSNYKVLKWVPRPSSSSTQTPKTDPQLSVPQFIDDPNTIDGSSDEEEEEEEEEGCGSDEVMIEDSCASPSNTFKMGRKTSRAVAATEGAGGQLAGLETGEIAEQIEIEDDEEEHSPSASPHDPATRPRPPSNLHSSPGPSPLPLEQPDTRTNFEGPSYEAPLQNLPEEIPQPSPAAQGDVTMEGSVLPPQDAIAWEVAASSTHHAPDPAGLPSEPEPEVTSPPQSGMSGPMPPLDSLLEVEQAQSETMELESPPQETSSSESHHQQVEVESPPKDFTAQPVVSL